MATTFERHSPNWDIVIYCVVMLMVLFLLGLIAAMAATAVPQAMHVPK